MKKRIISALLVICTLISICYYPFAFWISAEVHYTVTVEADGKAVSDITVLENGKTELTAVCSPGNGNAEYQWQICADVQADMWVNIGDADEKTLSVSYPMIISLLDSSDSVYLRASVTADGIKYYSEPVCVTVEFNAKLVDYSDKKILSLPKADIKIMYLDDPPPEYVTVTIKYLDWESKEPVYSPYIASIQTGIPFNQLVTSPTFLGYMPYTWDGEGDEDTHFTEAKNYNISGVYDADTEIVIYYRPIPVGYSVRYYFQNITNDMYTENVGLYRNDGTALTGTIVNNEILEAGAGETQGFTKLYHYPESVAADGSTVFECYYDRNYYFYKFDLNGGYGTEPIYARYGTPFTVPDPIRHGYVFAGWADVDIDPDTPVTDFPTAIGHENKSYKAVWETVETTYSVVYWLENADDENGDEEGNGYSYWGSVQVDCQSNYPVSGDDHKNLPTKLTDNAEFAKIAHYAIFDHADGTKTVAGDGSTVINVYFNRKEYNLKFYYAMESEESGTPHYYIVGGSTYHFGRRQNKTNAMSLKENEILLLDQYNKSTAISQRGEVDVLPSLNSNGESKGYIQGYDISTVNSIEYKYHYLMFSAKYGSFIENKWPLDVLNSVKRISVHNQNDWAPTTAMPAGWNGEYKVKYNFVGPLASNGEVNETLKAKQNILSDTILWYYDKEEDGVAFGEPDDNTVSYLCFWENGANVSWNIPIRFQYKIWLPYLDGVNYEHLPSSSRWTPTSGQLNGITNAGQVIGNHYYLYDEYATFDDSNISQQTIPEIIGFTNVTYHSYNHPNKDIELDDEGQKKYKEYHDFNVFYSRNKYDLIFMNYGGHHISSEEIFFESNISDKYFVPDYPSTLEPNAYVFDGWYLTPECFEGTEFNFTGATMPARDVTLYAKWKPKVHTVRFFSTYADMVEYKNTGNSELVLGVRNIDHGSVVGHVDTPTDPSIFNYTFGGWFYIGTDNKTYMFAEYDTRINRDMNVYANWGSKQARPYRIHYALNGGEIDAAWLSAVSAVAGATPKNQYSYTVNLGGKTRNYVYIADDSSYHLLVADDTSGFAYEGSTRTFYPKAGDPYNQLKTIDGENYNEGYFPTLASHSITIASETVGIEQPEHNVFTFFYVKPGVDINYTVNYLDQQTNLPLATSKNASTLKSVITERFLPIENYIPDAFYKRLILSVHEVDGSWVGDDANNVINFYYTYNTQSAHYAVHHMLQRIGTDGSHFDIVTGDYEEDQAIIEAIANIGDLIQIQPMEFPGFDLLPDKTLYADNGVMQPGYVNYIDGKYTINVTKNGTDLYIFYRRCKYPVEVHFLKYNTNEPVNPANDPVETIEDMWYGDTVAYNINDDTKKIKDEDNKDWALVDTENLTKSITVRSVAAQNVIVFYYIEEEYLIEYKIVGGAGGTLSREQEQSNVSIDGSTATPLPGYEFDGWFLDEECTQSANSKATITGTKIIPQSTHLVPIPGRNVFYARFKKANCNLTISRTNANDESNGDQIFVYKITNNDDPNLVYYVTVKGADSVTVYDLPAAKYTVTQMNDWSWRYADTDKIVDLHIDKTVTFDKAPIKQLWLNGNSDRVINKKD